MEDLRADMGNEKHRENIRTFRDLIGRVEEFIGRPGLTDPRLKPVEDYMGHIKSIIDTTFGAHHEDEIQNEIEKEKA